MRNSRKRIKEKAQKQIKEKNNTKMIKQEDLYPEETMILKELQEAIKKAETKQTVENIYLKVLEQNVQDEKKKYQEILNLEIEFIEEIKDKAKKEMQEEINTLESLRVQTQKKVEEANKSFIEQENKLLRLKETTEKEIEEEKKSLKEDFRYKKEQLFQEFENKENSLESLKQEYLLKIEKFEEEKKLKEKEFDDIEFLLKEEYEQKRIKLEEEIKIKDKNLLSKYNEKNTKFDEYVEQKKKELEEEKNKVQQELEETKTSVEKELDNKRKETDKSIKEEYETLEKEKEKVERYKEEIIKKVDDQIEDKRQAFIDEMIYLNSDYQNDLDKRQWELNKDEEEFKKKAKKKELEILQATKEYEEKVDKFNNEVETFNKNKIKYLEQYHFLHILVRKIKEHLFGSLIFLLFLVIFVYMFLYANEYKLFKNSFIASSIDRYIDSKNTNSEFTFALNTKNSVLAKFTELDGLNIDINVLKGGTFSENYQEIILNSGSENFVFERYLKNEDLIMKTPNFGQYIIFDDINEMGYTYKEDELNENILGALKKSLSKTKNANYTDVSKINPTGNDSFFKFINNSFFANRNYEYFYTIENQDDQLFKDIMNKLIESKNYDNFMQEEKDVATKLERTNSIEEIEQITRGIIANSKIKNNIINLKITENLELSNLDITFNIEYKDDTMASSVPMTIRVISSFETINEDISLEKAVFKMNSVKYENIEKTQEIEKNKKE